MNNINFNEIFTKSLIALVSTGVGVLGLQIYQSTKIDIAYLAFEIILIFFVFILIIFKWE